MTPPRLQIHVVGGFGERDSAGGAVQCIYPSLTGRSLSSLVKGKSICTDVYEERKIAQRRRRKEKKGEERPSGGGGEEE